MFLLVGENLLHILTVRDIIMREVIGICYNTD